MRCSEASGACSNAIMNQGMFITRILIGLAVTGLGVIMVFKTPWMLSLVGRIYFAEKNLGPGGSRIFFKLLGVVIILIGFLVVTNLFDVVVGGFFTRLFG